MATSNRSNDPTDTAPRPAGAEGDGLDAYPTYREGPTTSHAATASKATDTDLPRSKRTFGLPILLGLLVFALVIVIGLVGGGINLFATSDDALTPGDGATAPVAPAAENTPVVGEAPEASGTLDRDVEAQSQTSPGQVEATPGSIDVPGAEITEPVEEAPAQ